jgi:hypothetical protein
VTDRGARLPPAGWHDDPDDPASVRYWDGARWTNHREPKQPPPPKRLPPAGWHDDPDDPASVRYWDGARWTNHREPKQPPPPKRLPPAGWHDDPDDPASVRYWDGAQWTNHRKSKQPPPTSQPAQESALLRRLVSSVMKLEEKDVANRVTDVTGDVTDRAGRAASGVEDVAGDVADKVADGVGWVARLLKKTFFVVLFPLWLALLLFGCGPLS